MWLRCTYNMTYCSVCVAWHTAIFVTYMCVLLKYLWLRCAYSMIHSGVCDIMTLQYLWLKYSMKHCRISPCCCVVFWAVTFKTSQKTWKFRVLATHSEGLVDDKVESEVEDWAWSVLVSLYLWQSCCGCLCVYSDKDSESWERVAPLLSWNSSLILDV